MYRIVTAPTSTSLLATAATVARLGTSATTEKTEPLIKAASYKVAAALGFDPWYQEVEQSYLDDQGTDLELFGRPVCSITHVKDLGDEDLVLVAGTDYVLRRTGRRSGTGYLYRPDGWSKSRPASSLEADWLARYFCGWWLPTMSGAAPAGVPLLPDDIAEACWLIVFERFHADAGNPLWQRTEKGDSMIEFRERSVVQDNVGAIPAEAQAILTPYRTVPV